MWRIEPCADREGVDCHWCPFQEYGSDGEVLSAPSFDDVENACWHVGNDQGKEADWHPDIKESMVSKKVRVPNKIRYSMSPYLWTVVAGKHHDNACYDQAL